MRNRSTSARGAAWRVGQALVVLACIGAPVAAEAQQAVPSQVDPGQVQRRIPPAPSPELPPAPLQLPSPPVEALTGAPSVVLAGVVIEGATVFDPAALAPLYEDKLARKIGSAEIEEILQRITARYRERGYFLSRAVAQPQSLAAGILRITVVEGFVQRVTIGHARPGDEARLRAYAERVTKERPLTLATLERAVLLVNDLPGVRVGPSLRPIDENAGAYELVLDVQYRDFSGFAATDNRGPDTLGPWEAQVSGGVNSLLLPHDRLSLNLFTVPDRPRELLSAGLSYDLPLGRAGTRLVLSATRTDVRPEGNLAPLALDGRALHYVAQLNHPLVRTLNESLWLRAAFDALDSKEDEQHALLFDDALRVLRAGMSYYLADHWGGTNDVSFDASRGLGILGASPAGGGALSRANGNAVFTKFSATAARTQTLGAGWSLQLALAGQKSVDPLLISEQFALGGPSFGRGYDPAEITGDDGAAGSLELRYGRAVESRLVRSYQVYAFYDGGAVWNLGVSDATRRQTLSSLGGGVRLVLPHQLAASLEIARPLTRIVAAEGDKPVRVFASLSAAF